MQRQGYAKPSQGRFLLLSGKRFLVKAPILGIQTVAHYREVVRVPAGEIVEIVSGPRPDDKRLVDVRWGTRQLVMFAEDIQNRTEQTP